MSRRSLFLVVAFRMARPTPKPALKSVGSPKLSRKKQRILPDLRHSPLERTVENERNPRRISSLFNVNLNAFPARCVGLSFVTYAKLMSTSCSTARQHFPTAPTGHPSPKSMLIPPLSQMRLKSSSHYCSPSSFLAIF